MKVAVTASFKNGILWEAAQMLGSQAALARHLGIDQVTIGCWLNFKKVPDFTSEWGKKRYAEIDAKLNALTGCGLEIIFPPEVRSKQFLAREKKFQAVMEMPVENLIAAGAVPQLPPSPFEDVVNLEMKDIIEQKLAVLNDQQQKVVKMRFGLGDGEASRTLDEVAEHLGVTKERVRQIEAKALRILRHPEQSRDLRQFHYRTNA